jgi:hypothetical protein
MGEMRNAHKMFVREPEKKISLSSSRQRWEDNIKINLEVGCEVMDRFNWLWMSGGGFL